MKRVINLLGFVITFAIFCILTSVYYAISIFICILLHEFAHVLCAKYLGLKTSKLSFCATGCYAKINELDNADSGAQVLISSCGPLCNIVLCFVFAILSQIMYKYYYPLMITSQMNLTLFCFNLIPALPLDGGRILQGILSSFLPYGKAIKTTANISIGISIIIFSVFLYFISLGRLPVVLALISLIIATYSLKERKRVPILHTYKKRKKTRMVNNIAVMGEDKISLGISKFKKDCFNVISVIDEQGKVVRTITEVEVLSSK